MRFPRPSSRRGPRTAASPTPSLRHAALILAALAVLTAARSPHHTPQPPRQLAVLAPSPSSLDGRLPDGVPAGAVLTARLAGPGERGEPAESSGSRAQAFALAVEAPASVGAPAPAIEVRATPVGGRPVVVALAPAAPPPTVVAAALPPPPEVAPTSSRYATPADLEAALAMTSWPVELWPRVTAIAFCESGSDTDRDGTYDVVDTHAVGAGGRYIGALQIGAGHAFTQPYDLRTLAGNLAAGYEVWARAGGSFAPWGCR